MKKLFVFSMVSFLILMEHSSGQLVTISNLHQMPSSGDTVHYVEASAAGFNPLGAGPVNAKVWDYSGLANTGNPFYFYFIDTASVPPGFGLASFPTATLARGESGTSGYFYYGNSVNDINRLGWYLNSSNYGIYDPGTFATEFHFPITMGQSNYSTYGGIYAPLNLGEDSVRIDNGNIFIEADMQGQLILPTCTYNDVLRIHVVESFTVNAYLSGISLASIPVSDDYYYWFVDTILQPVLMYGITSSNGMPQPAALRYQSYTCTTDVLEINRKAFAVYPNPSSGKIIIERKDIFTSELSIEVFNLAGMKIFSTQLDKLKGTVIEFSDEPPGTYLVRVYSNETVWIEKVVIY